MIAGYLLPLIKKCRQWLYLVLSIVGIFHRALYIPHSDDKMSARKYQRANSDNKMVRTISGVDLEVSAVFGFRKTIVDGTRKDSPLRSSLLETERWTIFYCNSCKAILNSQRTRETQFLRKLFARPAFSRKSGQYTISALANYYLKNLYWKAIR